MEETPHLEKPHLGKPLLPYDVMIEMPLKKHKDQSSLVFQPIYHAVLPKKTKLEQQ